MDERQYQVLAPDSVAWFIQAALVADRSGNHHTRDLALREAKRVAEERGLADEPCYDCRTTAQRLEKIEDRVVVLEQWRQHADQFDALMAAIQRGA